MNPLHFFRPVYQPFVDQRQASSFKLRTAVSVFAVGFFGLLGVLGAQALQRQNYRFSEPLPGFLGSLSLIAIIASTTLLLRRTSSSFRHGQYEPRYHHHVTPVVVHQPPVYQQPTVPNYNPFPPQPTVVPVPRFQPPMYPLPQTRGVQGQGNGGMHPLPQNRFPDVNRVPAYQANQMHPGHRPSFNR